MPKPDDYPHADSRAAKMLADGLRMMNQEGISTRELAKRLNYKQSVVLSHMALGRVPIPIDRVHDFARLFRRDPMPFLIAVLEQRHPTIDWASLMTGGAGDGPDAAELVSSLELIARRPVREFGDDQVRVMREVAAEPHAGRRWLSVHEVAAIELLRELRPTMASTGLSAADRRALREALGTSA